MNLQELTKKTVINRYNLIKKYEYYYAYTTCVPRREREGGRKGCNDVIARPLRALIQCWPVPGAMNAVKRDEMHTMHRETR